MWLHAFYAYCITGFSATKYRDRVLFINYRDRVGSYNLKVVIVKFDFDYIYVPKTVLNLILIFEFKKML